MSKLSVKGIVLAVVAVAVLLSWHTGAEPGPGAEPGTGAEEPAFSATFGEPADAAAADNWPQFRGPGGLGIVEDAGVATSWSETENIVWKTEIEGLGHSSPVVWGDTIFLTTALQGEVIPGAGAPTHYIGGQVFKHPQAMGSDRSHTLKVMALDRASGEILWSDVAYQGRVYDDRHKGASYASATAVTDGERVYFYFGSQGVYAYDFDGNRVWGTDLGDFSYFGVGLGTSPVLYDNVLILQIDDGEGEGSFIVGLDTENGDQLWRTARAVEASWATPLLLDDVEGAPQLLTIGEQLLIAYDPRSGEELWQLDGLHNNAVHSPVWDGELVYVSAGYPRSVIQAIRPGRDAAEVVWEYRKGAAYVASNIVYDGYLYVTNDKGIITCLDAATGEVVYQGGRIPVPASMLMSSLLVVDGKIMLSTPEGDTFWIATGPEFSIAGHNSLDEPILTIPAIVGGMIYLRGRTHLYAIGSVDDQS